VTTSSCPTIERRAEPAQRFPPHDVPCRGDVGFSRMADSPAVDPPYKSHHSPAREFRLALVGRNPRSGFRRTVFNDAGMSASRTNGGFTCGGSALQEPSFACEGFRFALVARNPRSGFRRTMFDVAGMSALRTNGGFTCGGSALQKPSFACGGFRFALVARNPRSGFRRTMFDFTRMLFLAQTVELPSEALRYEGYAIPRQTCPISQSPAKPFSIANGRAGRR
jgi:hypothetical protein